MIFRKCACFAAFSLAAVLSAAPQTENNKLGEIRAELELVRSEAPQHADTRGASPRFTKVKHLLRDWVEQQLSTLPSDANGEDGAEVKLADRLNDHLQREHLFRETKPGETVDESTIIGFLEPIRLEYGRRQAYLVLQTGIEVNCG